LAIYKIRGHAVHIIINQ